LLGFKSMNRRRDEAAPATFSPAAQVGAVEGSPATLPASRYVFRTHLHILLRPLKRADWPETWRKIGARRRGARWSSPEELQLELNRSRRYGHSFVLMRIACRHDAEGGWKWGREIANAVGSLLRSVDRVWSEGTNVYLLLPECNKTMAEAMLARICEPLSKLLPEEERAAVSSAAFPDDGVTGAALFDALHGRSINPAMRPGHVAAERAPESPAA
jgi:hypothetical protein